MESTLTPPSHRFLYSLCPRDSHRMLSGNDSQYPLLCGPCMHPN